MTAQHKPTDLLSDSSPERQRTHSSACSAAPLQASSKFETCCAALPEVRASRNHRPLLLTMICQPKQASRGWAGEGEALTVGHGEQGMRGV